MQTTSIRNTPVIQPGHVTHFLRGVFGESTGRKQLVPRTLHPIADDNQATYDGPLFYEVVAVHKPEIEVSEQTDSSECRDQIYIMTERGHSKDRAMLNLNQPWFSNKWRFQYYPADGQNPYSRDFSGLGHQLPTPSQVGFTDPKLETHYRACFEALDSELKKQEMKKVA